MTHTHSAPLPRAYWLWLLLLVFLLFMLLCLIVLYLWWPREDTVVVDFSSGQIEVSRNEQPFHDVGDFHEIRSGDRIRTGGDGYATIRLGNCGYLEIFPNSVVTLNGKKVDARDGMVLDLEYMQGVLVAHNQTEGCNDRLLVKMQVNRAEVVFQPGQGQDEQIWIENNKGQARIGCPNKCQVKQPDGKNVDGQGDLVEIDNQGQVQNQAPLQPEDQPAVIADVTDFCGTPPDENGAACVAHCACRGMEPALTIAGGCLCVPRVPELCTFKDACAAKGGTVHCQNGDCICKDDLEGCENTFCTVDNNSFCLIGCQATSKGAIYPEYTCRQGELESCGNGDLNAGEQCDYGHPCAEGQGFCQACQCTAQAVAAPIDEVDWDTVSKEVVEAPLEEPAEEPKIPPYPQEVVAFFEYYCSGHGNKSYGNDQSNEDNWSVIYGYNGSGELATLNECYDDDIPYINRDPSLDRCATFCIQKHGDACTIVCGSQPSDAEYGLDDSCPAGSWCYNGVCYPTPDDPSNCFIPFGSPQSLNDSDYCSTTIQSSPAGTWGSSEANCPQDAPFALCAFGHWECIANPICGSIPRFATNELHGDRCNLPEGLEGAEFSHVYGPWPVGAPLPVNIKMPDGVAWQELDYSLRIGKVETEDCAPMVGNKKRLSCKLMLPSEYAGTYNMYDLALYVEGCDEPIYTKGINEPLTLPGSDDPSKKAKPKGGDDVVEDGSSSPGDPVHCDSGMDSAGCSAAGGSYDSTYGCSCP